MSAPPPPARPLYRADPDRMLHILAESQFDDPFLAFREVYANALDAARPGGRIRLAVSAREVVVEDDGPGLDSAGLAALTTLGASTARGVAGKIGRFGIGFASLFNPALGVGEVLFHARRVGEAEAEAVLLRFTPDVGGGVSIEAQPAARPPPGGGTRVSVRFDPERAPLGRVERVRALFEIHAAFADVETTLDGRRLGRALASVVDEAARGRPRKERAILRATAVEGAVGLIAIDPGRPEARVRVFAGGLLVTEVDVPRPVGRPWPRGLVGVARADDLSLVASRNGFVEDEAYARLLDGIQRLTFEAGYRLVRHYEARRDPLTRLLLLDALRRGLRTAATALLAARSEADPFSSALVRCGLFVDWFDGRRYAFEELVGLEEQGRFRFSSFRPHASERAEGPSLRADDAITRDIFRRIVGGRATPALARHEEVASPGWWSRLQDRFLDGPRAEYSLFRTPVPAQSVPPRIRALIEALEALLDTPPVRAAVDRVLSLGTMPSLGYGASRNVFGPVAAFRGGEIRFNVAHRAVRRLAAVDDPHRGARGLLPVLAHELAHACHELHDLDFYRTSRTLLRAMTSAVARVDAESLGPSAVVTEGAEARSPS